MARITPSAGRDLSAYEDDVWYKLTLTKIAVGNAKQSQFGPTVVLDFDDEDGNPGPGCLASASVNDSPNGKPAKLKAALNSLLGHDPRTPIVGFETDDNSVEYADGVFEQIEVGLRLEAKGERAGEDEPYKLSAFRPLRSKAKAAAAPIARAAAVDPDDIPF